MTAGLQIFDANGQLTFTSGDYLPRYLGAVQTGVSTGSLYNAALIDGTGTPFYICVPLVANNDAFYAGWFPPTISFNGGTMTWDFGTSSGGGSNCLVIYGIR